MQQFGVGKGWMLYHNNNIMIDTYLALIRFGSFRGEDFDRFALYIVLWSTESVLDLVVSYSLFSIFPNFPEGKKNEKHPRGAGGR